MNNFFNLHTNFNIEALTADSGFNTPLNYEYLFMKYGIFPIVNLNSRAAKEDFGILGVNEVCIPTCPKNPKLPMN